MLIHDFINILRSTGSTKRYILVQWIVWMEQPAQLASDTAKVYLVICNHTFSSSHNVEPHRFMLISKAHRG